jgi:hypothetical protein
MLVKSRRHRIQHYEQVNVKSRSDDSLQTDCFPKAPTLKEKSKQPV